MNPEITIKISMAPESVVVSGGGVSMAGQEASIPPPPEVKEQAEISDELIPAPPEDLDMAADDTESMIPPLPDEAMYEMEISEVPEAPEE